MNRCTTGGELHEFRGQLTKFCGPQEIRKVLSPKALRVVPRTATNLSVTDHGGGSGRFRGEKQRKVAGDRRQLLGIDSAHQIERIDNGQPESNHSKLNFWVRSLKILQSAGRLEFGEV
jgi:hypothetical protein